MFKRIFFDPKHSKVYLWEIDNGKTIKKILPPLVEYYIRDEKQTSPIKDIFGNSVVKKTAHNIKTMRELTQDIESCEVNVPQEFKILHSLYGNKNIKPDFSHFNICTIDIEVQSENEFPKVGEAKHPINLITVHFSKSDKIYTFGLYPYTGTSDLVKNYVYCPTEKTLIENFITFFRRQGVDILTGWMSDLFDIPYIIKRCERLKIKKSLSPVEFYQEKEKSGAYVVGGISILDGLSLYKKFTYDRKESYSLQAIGMAEIGEGKKDYEGTINNAWKTDWNGFVEYNVQDVILTKKINDKKKFIELTIQFGYEALIPFERVFSTISLVTGYVLKYLHQNNMVMPDVKVEVKDEEIPGAYVYAEPGFYNYLMSYDIESMYPHMIKSFNISPETIVLNPKNTTDLIKTPLSEYKEWETQTGKKIFGGIYYRKDKIGVLNQIVSKIFQDRKDFKTKAKICNGLEKGEDDTTISCYTKIPKNIINKLKEDIEKEGGTSEYYNSQQQIRKILINSVYGSLANKYFSFYNVNNARVITLGGQNLIRFLSDSINKYFKENWKEECVKHFPEYKDKEISPIKKDVIKLLDTDSNYVCFDEIIKSLNITFKDDKEFREWAINFDSVILKPFFDKVLKEYADSFEIEQLINFKREKIISQKFILAKKKYADLVIDVEGEDLTNNPKTSITGIEIVRTDTPHFCRNKIKNVVNEIFLSHASDREKIIEVMRDIKKDFLKATIEDIAIPSGISDYTKWSLSIEEYAKDGLTYKLSTPIHARASINYNYIIHKHKFPLQPITNGTKMKYVHVFDHKNEIHQDIIGFIGKWPKYFNDLFEINYDLQWEKGFQSVIQRFFDVLKWGNIVLEKSSLEEMIVF